MAATFPVVHSILDPAALAGELSRRFRTRIVSCQLVSRGSNDIYRARSADASFAVRVVRAGWRTESELGYELGLVRFVHARGIHVAEPLGDADGRLFFSLPAPEGERPVIVFRWLDGAVLRPPFSAEMAARVGEVVAKIHESGREFAPAFAKRVDTLGKIRGHGDALQRLFFRQDRVLGLLASATDWLEERVAALPPSLPRAHVHGDAHFGNVLVANTGELYLLDFDECGEDLAVKDLLPFIWRNEVEGLAADLNAGFVAGYERVRPLETGEKAALPLLLAVRHLYLLATLAGTVNRMGPVPGFDARESHYVGLLEARLNAAGYPR